MCPHFLTHLGPETCHGGTWSHLGPCHDLMCPHEGHRGITLSLAGRVSQGELQALAVSVSGWSPAARMLPEPPHCISTL